MDSAIVKEETMSFDLIRAAELAVDQPDFKARNWKPASIRGKPISTIGFEKRHNKALRIDDEEAFVRAMLADIPPAPPQAAQIRAANSGFKAAAE